MHRLLAPLLLLLLAGCASLPADGGREGDVYQVQRGDTLYSIAWRHGVDYRTVARLNHIEPPFVIHPGQRLRLRAPAPGGRPLAEQSRQRPPALVADSGSGSRASVIAPHRPRAPQPLGRPLGSGPEALVQAPPPPTPAPAREAAPRPSQPPATAPVATPARPTPPRSTPPAAPSRPATPPPRSAVAIAWQWPTDGGVTKNFSASADGKQGINIAGNVGQPVRAAAGGRVVYSGSGLRGYGRLIIIKHDGSYLTAYGYNNELLVGEGETVQAGQRIATMGMGSGSGASLHFELRRDGRPVDPVPYLPRR